MRNALIGCCGVAAVWASPALGLGVPILASVPVVAVGQPFRATSWSRDEAAKEFEQGRKPAVRELLGVWRLVGDTELPGRPGSFTFFQVDPRSGAEVTDRVLSHEPPFTTDPPLLVRVESVNGRRGPYRGEKGIGCTFDGSSIFFEEGGLDLAEAGPGRWVQQDRLFQVSCRVRDGRRGGSDRGGPELVCQVGRWEVHSGFITAPYIGSEYKRLIPVPSRSTIPGKS